MSYGRYPDITLADARERHASARRMLASGIDPMAQRKAEKTANRDTNGLSFREVAAKWHERWKDGHVTLIALRYKPSGHIELVNGGHVYHFIVHTDGKSEPIADSDIPVCLFLSATFHSIQFTLPPKARLVLLSDGITEAEDASGEQFGANGLLHELATADPVHTIFTSMHQFSGGAPPSDDCSLLVIDRTA